MVLQPICGLIIGTPWDLFLMFMGSESDMTQAPPMQKSRLLLKMDTGVSQQEKLDTYYLHLGLRATL